ncbi:MAG: hypothetical protein SF029_01320 [bacterium]|nr:hypothetical protein [bacterium]
MSDLGRWLILLCGGSLACVILMVLAALSLLRAFGRPGWGTLLGVVPLAFSLFGGLLGGVGGGLGGLFGGRDNDTDPDDAGYIPSGRVRPTPEAVRTRTTDVDFDNIVAQSLNASPTFTAQAAPTTPTSSYGGASPAQSGFPPPNVPRPGGQLPANNLPPAAPAIPGIPVKTGVPPSTIPTIPGNLPGGFPGTSGYPPNTLPPGTPPATNAPPAVPPSTYGADFNTVRPAGGTQPNTLPPGTIPGTVSSNTDVLGPITRPDLRNRGLHSRDARARQRRRDSNAREDEIFGGLLDGNGDGFIDG